MAQVPPQRAGATSYLTLLAGALECAGVEVVTPDIAELWRLGWARSVDLVHLHWLEFIAPSAPGGIAGLARTVIRHVRLVTLLAWLRIRGISLVWTVHNLRPTSPSGRAWSHCCQSPSAGSATRWWHIPTTPATGSTPDGAGQWRWR